MIEHPDNAASSVMSLFRERGLALAIVISVSVIISLSQGGISYSVLLGALRDRFNVDIPLLASLQWLIRAGLLLLAARSFQLIDATHSLSFSAGE